MLTDKRYIANLMGDLKAILLATDGSSHSRAAMEEGFSFASACNTRLTLLNVLEFNPEYFEHFSTIGVNHLAEKKEKIQDYYEKLREQIANDNVELKTLIEISQNPHEVIISEAVKGKYDLIIMGKHGESGFKKLLMGSVTAKVISEAPCKVLAAGEGKKIKGENILLATDGSRFSIGAETEAINMAARCPHLKKFIAVSAAHTAEEFKQAEANIENVIHKCKEHNVKVDAQVVIGEPYKIIVDKAKDYNIDIIIMGTHGRTGIERLFLGSVALKVIGLSDCSVLVTKEI
ncbi:MAG: universal stress protein [Nitrospirae bacterium]|nr:universal stress protein [Nitrospirota bacterium]MBF0540758.1 universal stress protein [Nitrospirota bacterium]